MIEKRVPNGASETVDLVVSLLLRHPELSRVNIAPRKRSITFCFILNQAATRSDRRGFRAKLGEHIMGYHSLARRRPEKVGVKTSITHGLTFIAVQRDTRTVSRDEIAMIVSFVNETFTNRLLINPPADDSPEEDFAAREESVGSALDALHRGTQNKSLVGFRDDRRVLIYFAR